MKPYDIGQALTSCESLESKSILRVKNGGKAAKDKKLDLRIGEFLLCLLVSRDFSNIIITCSIFLGWFFANDVFYFFSRWHRSDQHFKRQNFAQWHSQWHWLLSKIATFHVEEFDSPLHI